ncbi:MAG TPA: NADH-quinone oxidoreductase subunit L [Euryarchaeota archaeon]|nr:NADH-quinone oxidoreductase subunit L [Euryarchaeota archaeon]
MMIDYAWLIPVFPIIGFLIISLVPKKWLIWEGGAPYIIGMSTASFVLSILVIIDVLNGHTLTGPDSPRMTWLSAGSFELTFGIWIDQLTAVMLLVVSLVGTLVVIYSVGYMHGEGETKRRYYAEIALFIGVMFGLVLADNFVEMFIFWELVGLCSYLLIGFWKHKPSAASAAKRAFIVTRVGDIMLLSGLIILLRYVGTLDFSELFAEGSLEGSGMSSGMATLSMILLFGGAIGKSAQFPLHEWLPDAMEGPTTVSALIHAATMVKAGVYLVARSYPMLVQTPDALAFIAIIGGITALIAATNALVAVDIKRVLAYSTISQLGYMMLALGAGGLIITGLMHDGGHDGLGAGYSSGIFHMMNHAFFKALLFLAAGSVIHAVGTNDMLKMGGLGKTMKITSITMLIGSLSIAGIPPFSGFWSKDEVLASTFHAFEDAGSYSTVFLILWIMGVATAFMTAFYMFRMWFMTFTGKQRSDAHAHESPVSMTVPLMILASLAAVSGFAFFIGRGFFSFMSDSISSTIGSSVAVEAIHPLESLGEIFTSPLTYASLIVSAVGLFTAYSIYYKGAFSVSRLASGVTGKLQKLLAERYYISWFYDAFAYNIIYGISLVADIFDRYVIDGAINGMAWLSSKSGAFIRRSQTGQVQNYVAAIVIGGCLLLLFLIVFEWGEW